MIKIITGYIIAFIFWFIMFSPWTSSRVNFWVMMVISTGLLTIYSLYIERTNLKEIYSWQIRWIIIGLLSACSLYMLFWCGNILSEEILDFAKEEVLDIYSTKEQGNKIIIGFLLLLWIGPAEEIFWRGFTQNLLSKKITPVSALLINSLIYSLVHIWSFNLMLISAALICGLLWGYIYMKHKNVIPCIISHAIWDLFVFIIIPFN